MSTSQVQPIDPQTRYTGVVTRLNLGRGFGFISVTERFGDAFFHARGLMGGLTFDEQLTGRRVQFNMAMEARGLRAYHVAPVE